MSARSRRSSEKVEWVHDDGLSAIQGGKCLPQKYLQSDCGANAFTTGDSEFRKLDGGGMSQFSENDEDVDLSFRILDLFGTVSIASDRM